MDSLQPKPRIVLGVIGADCHAVGNKILTSVFTKNGFEVVNLGVMVSQVEFIDAAIDKNADAILVSSIYGHGEIDCEGFRNLCVERGIANIILYVGGNLVIGKMDGEQVESKFIKMGFDRVFAANCDLDEVSRLLNLDVSERRRKSNIFGAYISPAELDAIESISAQ